MATTALRLGYVRLIVRGQVYDGRLTIYTACYIVIDLSCIVCFSKYIAKHTLLFLTFELFRSGLQAPRLLWSQKGTKKRGGSPMCKTKFSLFFNYSKSIQNLNLKYFFYGFNTFFVQGMMPGVKIYWPQTCTTWWRRCWRDDNGDPFWQTENNTSTT